MATTIKSIQLFFQEGSSDKVYNAAIVKDGDAYTVTCEWGRRGSSLQQGSKAIKVPLATAQKKFDSLVREKTNKGYQAITSDVQPAAVAPPEGQGSGSRVMTGRRAKVGIAAQLTSELEESQFQRYMSNDDIVAQQKVDGNRILVHVNEDALLITNRDGQVSAKTDARAFEGLAYLPHGTIVDGEFLGNEYWLFDVLSFAGDDIRERGYIERYEILNNEIEPALTGNIQILPCAAGKKAKQKLHDKLRAARAEGLIFKEREAPYVSGRHATQRKYKFIKSADVVILENAGNAYLMAVYDGRKLFEIGKVASGTTNAIRKALDSALGRGEKPVCEVQYLYATDDHQLFQPVFMQVRSDKAAKDCLRDQLVQTSKSVIV